MNTCLRSRALLLLSAGEGTSEQQAHLATCTACAARYRQFAHDLGSIERVLRTTSPPAAPFLLRFALRRRWLPAAAAFAVTIMLVWEAYGYDSHPGQVWQRKLPMARVFPFWKIRCPLRSSPWPMCGSRKPQLLSPT